MRVLHVVYDEKFIPFIDETFRRVPAVTNSYLVIVADAGKPLKFLERIGPKMVVDKHTLPRIDPAALPHDAIIIHYLDPLKVKAVKLLHSQAPIAWSGWGGDYYDAFAVLSRNTLGTQTLQLQKKLNAALPLHSRIRKGISALLYRHWHEAAVVRFMKHINLFSAPIPEDYTAIRAHLPLAARYQQINYASLERTFDQGPPMTAGRDLLVGNSSSASNNHLEIFELLKGLDLQERRIIVPLSYGDATYRDAIIQVGRSIFGEQFVPIVDFMTLPEYNALIATCSIAIMGHRRQQAVGNIATMLHKGARIFLDDTTTTYQFLTTRGAVISKLSDLADRNTDLLRPLSAQERQQNIHVVQDFWNESLVQHNACEFVLQLQRCQADAQPAPAP